MLNPNKINYNIRHEIIELELKGQLSTRFPRRLSSIIILIFWFCYFVIHFVLPIIVIFGTNNVILLSFRRIHICHSIYLIFSLKTSIMLNNLCTIFEFCTMVLLRFLQACLHKKCICDSKDQSIDSHILNDK